MIRAAVSVLMLCLTLPSWAQFETGTILGVVRDRTGSVVPGARVVLSNIETGQEVTQTTSEDGQYEFFQLRPAHYRMTVEKTGFTLATVSDVEANVGVRRRVDIELSVGQVSESVNVVAAATMVETDSSQRGQTIKDAAIVELPLNGRQYSSLTLLTTGTRQSPISTGGFTVREGAVNVNGLRSTINNYMLDGVDNNAYGTSNQGFSNQVMQPPPDAVAEFQVVTNNMSAEYGRSGGATINVAYKSGANRFSGSAWEFYRNRSLNAMDYFRPRDGKKPAYNRNQFGFTLGGPIVKDRLFWFIDYEGYRQVSRSVVFSNLPTSNDRAGIFNVPIQDPIHGGILPANTPIPSSLVIPFARQVFDGLVPAYNNNSRSSNFYLASKFQDYTDKYDVKLDYDVNARFRIYGRVGQRKANIYEQPSIPRPSGGGGNGYTDVMNQALMLGTSITLSPTSLLEVRFAMTKTEAGKAPPGLGENTMQNFYGISGLPSNPLISGGLTTQVFNGVSDLGRQATNPQWQYPTLYDPKLNWSGFFGKHSLKAGFEMQMVDTEVQDVNPLYGRDTYQGAFSRPATGPFGDAATYSIADFLFGARNSYALVNLLIAQYRQVMYFGYFQDDWRLTSKLTLNLGVRYEFATPQWERNNILTNFDPVTRTMLKATDGSLYDRSLINPDFNNWAPRIGLSYQLAPATVLRSAFGMNYVHFNRAGGGNLLAINGPQVVNALIVQSPAQAGFRNTQDGYPQGLTDSRNFDPLKANITYMPPGTRTTYVMSWYFGIQHELAKNTLIDVAYVGNRSNKLLTFADYNQAAPNYNGATTPLQLRRPISTWSDITYAFNGGIANYNSFQVRFERRFQGGVYFLNAFTWSKAMDMTGGALEGINGSGASVQNFYNIFADMGPSPYDQKYTNVATGLFQLPFGRGQKWGSGWGKGMNAIAGGWQLGGILSTYTGGRINLRQTLAGNFAVSGIPQDWRGSPWFRPNVIGPPVLQTSRQVNEQYLDPQSVVLPIATGPDGNYPFGNAGRNIATMPAFANLDFSVLKDFNLGWEKSALQFRAEFFNFLNITNYRTVESSRSSASFGQFLSTYDKRQVQLALRFTF